MTWKYADELEQEYRNDLKGVRRRLEFLKKKESYLSKLKKDCEEQGKWKKIPIIVEERADARKRIKILGEVVSSSMYSIEWLRDAKEPGARREISRRSRYQRTVYWSDMDRQTFNEFRGGYDNLTDDDLLKLKEFMTELTDREKDVVVSVVGKGNSYQETADFIGISKSSVRTYLDRGMNKINIALTRGSQTTLF
ncbi:MAG: sigma factor-like helix-turn-helix DNA-binding protein [Vagococcus sp.]|uniref:sigma factor-like helix-turn-helix DNA-binding protein n=1 Tax=Vagococcus sp. TaxID=1933889 RepID=UPI002FCA2BFD